MGHFLVYLIEYYRPYSSYGSDGIFMYPGANKMDTYPAEPLFIVKAFSEESIWVSALTCFRGHMSCVFATGGLTGHLTVWLLWTRHDLVAVDISVDVCNISLAPMRDQTRQSLKNAFLCVYS